MKQGGLYREWSQIDEDLSARLPAIVAQHLDEIPPRRVTAKLLAEDLSWNASHLKRSLDRLPKFTRIWLDAIETTGQWNERRKNFFIGRMIEEGATMPREERTALLRIRWFEPLSGRFGHRKSAHREFNFVCYFRIGCRSVF